MKPDDNDGDEARCMSCGGRVDAHGMAHGGMVEGSEFAEDGVNLEGESTQRNQAEAEQKAARKAFISAVKGRK